MMNKIESFWKIWNNTVKHFNNLPIEEKKHIISVIRDALENDTMKTFRLHQVEEGILLTLKIYEDELK
nr:MAG: hypothetical protein [Lokiarchaeota virus Fenrir Meg22_1012]URC17247.1 MAG: hypothetical protein [Lokiarchaeota virus Fenrir Meg22_1214]